MATGNGDDNDRTVIRPNPGGRRPDAPGGAAQPPPQQQPIPPQAAPPQPIPPQAPAPQPIPQQPIPPQAMPPQAVPPQPIPQQPIPVQPVAQPLQVGPATPAAMPGPAVPLQGSTITDLPSTGRNPLVDAAIAPLALIQQLRTTAHHGDVAGLRDQLVQQIGVFETTASGRGVAPETVNAARYCLCTALDEAVLGTPWGGGSIWNTQSLLATFHKETWGGEKLFQLLENLMHDPGRNLDLLEFIYVLLCLGFHGKYRVMERGEARLEELRMSIFERLRPLRGDFERELSPSWQGVGTRVRRRARQIPLWVVAAMVGAVVLSSHAVMTFVLSETAAPVYDKIQAIEARLDNPGR